MRIFRWTLTLTLGVAIAGSTATADELPKADQPGDSQSISINVSSSTTNDGVNEPQTEVTGKVTITGPDGVSRDLYLNDELPDGVTVKMIDGGVSIEALLSGGEDAEPRSMIGVTSRPVSDLLRKHLKLGMNGVVVTGVSKGMPAAEAGIVEGDIIVKAGGMNITTMEDLAVVVKEKGEEPFDLELIHEGVARTVQLKAKMAVPEAMEFPGLPLLGHKPGKLQVFRMGPGMELHGTEDIEAEISEMMKRARKAIKDSQIQPGASEVESEMKELQKRVAELEKRLRAAKTSEE